MLFVAAVPLVSLLIFAVADAVWLCYRATRELGRTGETAWPSEVLAATSKDLGVPKRYLSGWIDVQFIAAWTRELVPIYYPALVIFLMIVARSTAFDGWEPAPIGLLIVFILSLAYTATSAYVLRQMAERVRRQSRDRLLRHLLRVRRRPKMKGRAKQIEQLIAEVESLRTGAFAPLTQQTFVRAALLPLSGLAALPCFSISPLAIDTAAKRRRIGVPSPPSAASGRRPRIRRVARVAGLAGIAAAPEKISPIAWPLCLNHSKRMATSHPMQKCRTPMSR